MNATIATPVSNAKEVKAKNAANSKNLITDTVTDKMSVRIYSKSRAKGEVKFKKKRDSLTFKTTAEANAAVNALVDAGAKLRKIELIAEDGTVVNTYKPNRVRLTPTKEEKDAIKAKKDAERKLKAEQKVATKLNLAKIKAEAKAAAVKAKADAEKANAKLTTAKAPQKTKTTKNVAAEALA
jgi:hypothetical protein